MNSYAYAREAEAELYLEWLPLPRKHYPSTSMEELSDYRSVFSSTNAFVDFRCPIIGPTEADQLRGRVAYIHANDPKQFPLDTDYARKRYAEAWQSLMLDERTIDSVNEAFASLSPNGELVAIHIRRGDVLDELLNCSINKLEIKANTLIRRFVPLASARRLCQLLARDGKRFVIFTDDRSAKADGFMSEFLAPSMASSEVKQALAELLLMSRSRAIYCPHTSNYSTCSSLGGQVPQNTLSIAREEALEELFSLIDSRLGNSDAAQRKEIISKAAARYWK